MVKILIIFGTRPEAIKLAPVIRAFQEADHADMELRVCVTAQHRGMLDQVLEHFDIQPDYDLNLMQAGQDLYDLTGVLMREIKPVLQDFNPDWVIVQGDTTTTVMAALAAFYHGARVAHVEAGLRTYNKKAPFPEEINRQLISRIADLHFAPTQRAKDNLVSEGIKGDCVFVVGNTGVDALQDRGPKTEDPGLRTKNEERNQTEDLRLKNEDFQEGDCHPGLDPGINRTPKMILVTGHRRENFGEGLQSICRALIKLAERGDVEIVYPVHLNPTVQGAVREALSGYPNIRLTDPLSYPEFVGLMKESYLILTDSGGIQEEAPFLGKPVLVMREVTERNELVEAGGAFLVGTETDQIVEKATLLLDNPEVYRQMAQKRDIFGDGHAADRIILAMFQKVL